MKLFKEYFQKFIKNVEDSLNLDLIKF